MPNGGLKAISEWPIWIILKNKNNNKYHIEKKEFTCSFFLFLIIADEIFAFTIIMFYIDQANNVLESGY